MFSSSQFITRLDLFTVLLQYCCAFAAVQFSNHAVKYSGSDIITYGGTSSIIN